MNHELRPVNFKQPTISHERLTNNHFMKINHLGIATKGLDEALRFWEDALGLENVHTEVVEEQKVRVAMLPIGESRVELLEPTSEDSPISKFIEKRGAGIHHIAVETDDIRASLAKLKSAGARLIDEEPKIGAEGCLVAFVHPAATGGVLLELVQKIK
jgi:methylmalonyl-CoA epimerase